MTQPKMFRKVVTFKRLSKDDEERPPDLVLHERLTSYLDSVEVCLLKQISSKANTFFKALKNLRNFKNEVNESCAKMRTLRGIVRLLKQSLVIDLAKVPQNRIRRRNLERLSHTVALMTEVRSTKNTVQSLLEVGDYHGSLNLIDRVQSVLKEELSGLTSMRHLSRQLLKFQNLIRDTMCDRFLELAVSLDLSRHSSESHDRDEDMEEDREEEEDKTRRIRQRLELKEKLLPLVRGLLRIGHLQNLISKYRTRVSELLTRVIKTSVSASLNETELLVAAAASELNTKDEEAKSTTTNVKSVSVVTQLRSLGPQGFMSLLEVVLEHLSIVTSRASEIHRTLMSVLLDCGPASNLSKDSDQDQSNESAKTLKAKLEQEGCERESREALEYVWKLAQRHASKLFQVRQDVHINLSLNEIAELWHVVRVFTEKTEKRVGRRGDILMNTIREQMENQLQRLHKNNMQELVACLDSEMWDQCAPTPSEQRLLRALVESSEVSSSVSTKEDNSIASIQTLISEAIQRVSKSKKKQQRGVKDEGTLVHIKGRSFRVVRSMLVSLRIIASYIQVSCQSSFLCPHAIRRLLELLQLFNSRTTQLVLGAGALQTTRGRLKQITAKHLALVTQCLSLVVILVPCLRKLLSRTLNSKHHLLLNNLDRMSRDYNEHVNKIFNKLVSIVRNVVDTNCREHLSKETWSDDQPGKWIKNIAKALSQLHSLLVQFLPPDQVKTIFTQIVTMLNTRIPAHFKGVEASSLSSQAVQRILLDVSHLVAVLRRVRGLRDRGRTLDRYFRDRYVLCLI